MSSANGYKVLEIYSHFDSRPGDVLLSNNFITVGAGRRWRMEDIQDGLDYARDNGWIKSAPLGWRLTERGFQEFSHTADVPRL